MFRKILKYAFWSIAVFASLLGTVYLIAWKSPQYYSLAQKPGTRDSIVPFRDYRDFFPQ